ncbi:MAG TPA: pyridoxamine 5'-phosphate oxidase [Gemmatimonadaceae bacterium]|nr:pyridoxamine 5'-phosphate oxidase [Gemmatimonadaceae bacterium]
MAPTGDAAGGAVPGGAADSGDPIARFEALLAAAEALDRAVLPEPTAMTLATVGPDGRPSARIVLLKSVGADGFVFYTNLRSRKGRELLGNPHAALCFHWQALEQQVRVEGPVTLVPDAEADGYFATRPRISQLGAWASDQSEPLAEYAHLERRLREAEQRFGTGPVPRPPHWSGFRLLPHCIEFWRSRPFRLHERERFERHGDAWRMVRLYP